MSLNCFSLLNKLVLHRWGFNTSCFLFVGFSRCRFWHWMAPEGLWLVCCQPFWHTSGKPGSQPGQAFPRPLAKTLLQRGLWQTLPAGWLEGSVWWLLVIECIVLYFSLSFKRCTVVLGELNIVHICPHSPLPDEMVQYARTDTHYLLYIYDCVRVQLLDFNHGQPGLLQSVWNKSSSISLKVCTSYTMKIKVTLP